MTLSFIGMATGERKFAIYLSNSAQYEFPFVEVGFPSGIVTFSNGGVDISIRSYREDMTVNLSESLLDSTTLQNIPFEMECSIQSPTVSGLYHVTRLINMHVRNQKMYRAGSAPNPTYLVLDSIRHVLDDIDISYEENFQNRVALLKKGNFTLTGTRKALLYEYDSYMLSDYGLIQNLPQEISVSDTFDSTSNTFTAPNQLTVFDRISMAVSMSRDMLPSGMIFCGVPSTDIITIPAYQITQRAQTGGIPSAPFYFYNEDAKFAISTYAAGTAGGTVNAAGVLTFVATSTQQFTTSGTRALGTTETYLAGSGPEDRVIDIFGTVKTTYSGARFRVSFFVENDIFSESDPITIGYMPTPHAMYLGTISSPVELTSATINMRIAASVASGIFQLDQLIVIPKSETVNVISLDSGILRRTTASGINTLQCTNNYYQIYTIDYPYAVLKRSSLTLPDDVSIGYKGSMYFKSGIPTKEYKNDPNPIETGKIYTVFPGSTSSALSQDYWRLTGINGGLAPLSIEFNYPSGTLDFNRSALSE